MVCHCVKRLLKNIKVNRNCWIAFFSCLTKYLAALLSAAHLTQEQAALSGGHLLHLQLDDAQAVHLGFVSVTETFVLFIVIL